jgi:tRNA threonylcarbamoyl adenosine modification protein (Sua5/YciO/YrdC/YwlC family)
MTIAVQHFKFSSSISLLSQIPKTFHIRTFGTNYGAKFQTYPSVFQNINQYRGSPFRIQRYQQQKIANSMTRVVHQDEKDKMGNEENQARDGSISSAKLIPSTNLNKCGERLRQGGLVAFPTETVYGLGCNALDPSAIIKVFEAKERPLTDPLITHITDNQVAFDLWAADADDSYEGKALQSLCKQFWPGPLTLVAKAAPNVPPILMANTGFCACRSPQHPISIALINAAKVPIAAPSANKFGHVSPTRSSHVWHDLQHEDVWIIEEDQKDDSEITSCCEVGVESSVAKIEMSKDDETGKIILLRQGAVSLRNIEECLEQAGLAKSFEVVALTKRTTDETVPNVAPGQTIRHYSPDVPSFILSRSLFQFKSLSISQNEKEFLSRSVLIDFGGRIKTWKHLALAYRDLSESAESAEATKHVFETLRWAEKIENANQILFPEISDEIEIDHQELRKNKNNLICSASQDALTLALKDRLTRAASGIVIECLGS